MPTRDSRKILECLLENLIEKSEFLGSWGSMVAKLKLKGIDGRAPPGVELAAAVGVGYLRGVAPSTRGPG